MDYPKRINLARLRSCHCLSGHFELDGYHLHQRYPEVLTADRYRLFTFVRDPLEVQLSLFRYETLNKQSNAASIEEHLALRPNYLASIFPATLDDYKEAIDRYSFVGILEKSEASVRILASILGKPYRQLPWLNKSRENTSVCRRIGDMSPELIVKFKEENKLDYLIYDYCLGKFNDIAAETRA